MKLPQSELHLWYFKLDEKCLSSNLDLFIRLLSADEIFRMRSFKFDDRRHVFAITRAFCRIVLSQYVPQVNPVNWQFKYNAFGRPRAILPGNAPKLDFNISHSKGIVVMAVAASRHSIGVDIEVMETASSRSDIAARFFSAVEQADLNELPPAHRIERFYELWAAKESYIKARGMGLFIPLETFSVSVRRDSGTAPFLQSRLISTPMDDDPEKWRIMLCDFEARYKLALCSRVRSPQESLTLRYFDFEFYANTSLA